MIKLTKNGLYNIGAMTKDERANYNHAIFMVKHELNTAWHGSKSISRYYAEDYILGSDITYGYDSGGIKGPA